MPGPHKKNIPNSLSINLQNIFEGHYIQVFFDIELSDL